MARPENLSTTAGRTRDEAVAKIGLLRVALALQIAAGLLWGVSMLGFARQIVLSDPSGPHLEKIALEGATHLALVFGALLVWRDPIAGRSALLVMIVLNALWVLTDLVYIPLLGLSEADFYAKVVVNAGLAVLLTLGGKRARVL
jgi:hypothetical protein